jgi:cytochrome c peroxidase
MFWDGRAATIEEQVFHPVRNRNEMNLPWQQAAQRLNSDPQYRQPSGRYLVIIGLIVLWWPML